LDIDLNRKMLKVTEESERVISPKETVAIAATSLEDLNITLEQDIKNFDSLFWASAVTPNSPASVPGIRMGGKGLSKEQCLASGYMEFVERWSMYRNDVFHKEEYKCLDLRDNFTYSMKPVLELRNTKCMAAGNNYEEAVLHCLHELIETRTSINSNFQACRVVSIDDLFPEMPQWIKDSVLLVLSPTWKKEFYKFTAIQYPFNREFDNRQMFKISKSKGRISIKPGNVESKAHSPNSGGAAGLNPRKTALRAINEIFQFQNMVDDFKGGKRKPLSDDIQVAETETFINYETESITDDIKLILRLLGDDVFTGIIDLTDEQLNIPVVKLISDWDPNRSLVSKEVLGEFFYI